MRRRSADKPCGHPELSVFEHLDVPFRGHYLSDRENNTGKSNFLHAIRMCLDAGLSSTYRSLLATDIHSTVDMSHPNQVLIGLELTEFEGKINEEALVGAWQCKRDLPLDLPYAQGRRAEIWSRGDQGRQPDQKTITGRSAGAAIGRRSRRHRMGR